MLVETTTVEQLIDRLKKGKHRSSQEIIAKSTSNIFSVTITPFSHALPVTVTQAANIDDDIVADRQKMSLKCPVGQNSVLHKHHLTCNGS